jgi:hypothetical protein
MKRLSGRREQSSKDASPPRRRAGKQLVDGEEAAATDQDLGYQSPDQVMKDLIVNSSSESDDDDHRKKLYIMYGGSWQLASCREIKSLRREVLSATPGVPKAAPHQWWHDTSISFGPSVCLENMAGVGILPLVTSPTIANVMLYHVLIDGGAGLNLISYVAFKQLQILESQLVPSRPFSGVGPMPVFPLGSITLPVTFGSEENFRTENVMFDVAEVNLPFNAIIGRLALYQFMITAHYGYLVMKMSSPAGVLTVRGDRSATVAAVEKLHALAADTLHSGKEGEEPSASRAKVPAKVPKARPSGANDVPVNTVQVGTEPSQVTCIAGNLGDK